MAIKTATRLFSYRYRYYIGYSIIALLFVSLLLFAGLYVPGGLASTEVNSVIKSAGVDIHQPSTLAVTSLPYILSQQLSIEILGISNFSIKLPSLIFAAITSVSAIFLLRRWFSSNIAVLATMIMITTGQFLFVAQLGASSITFIMWSVLLLLSASMITGGSSHKTFWKVVFFVTAGLSLYTPLSLYLLIAIVSAALLHPHVRYVLKRISLAKLFLFGLVLLAFVAPLAYLIYLDPDLGLLLLGLPSNWPPDIFANASIIAQQYLAFFEPVGGNLMTPVFGLGSMILILLGAFRLFKTRYTARSYTVTAWFVLLIPIVLINPAYTSITFVPFLLLLASGLESLLRSWYSLFPRNPYARVAGLLPLIVLVSGLLISGVDRYVYGYHYDPMTVNNFTRDLTLLNYQGKPDSYTTLLVDEKEQPFYDAVAKYSDDLAVTTIVPSQGSFTATKAAHQQVENMVVSRIIVTSHSQNADRFYIYNNQ
ncbi:hypothetical protein A2707_01005 [Candidatus Saccharibacteria bacterium RIFCSPHIGHO2_01_FULL_45_15]|nr:MAG: hypothetical protein A2707_01005 [Candidatus Saccharibacteria bacterium RIFCSPHIGHO2_01_FULL_45_15]OGL26951.1 MAG: hypothetical protein A3C39_02120 [Candidatus Saccharibacteria bacterium RIFCSPHIGHO2_02_FULL_46_12]OGL32305.1 MAG: hypothetical protein A3E76_02830 [Candidatus Saccharibacteria bacterium RIFCSPHIGHO2_12_FULL_44_22]